MIIMPIAETQLNPHPPNTDTLRLELKAWEKEFANAHQGRKASREDIKQHPEIGIASLSLFHLEESIY
jgi:hypothetical protein